MSAYLPCRYTSEDWKIGKLQRGHRLMANLLHKAEQQGILDVYLVKVTHHEVFEYSYNEYTCDRDRRESDCELQDSETYIHDWRRLDGSEPEWEKECLHIVRDGGEGTDCILQVGWVQAAFVSEPANVFLKSRCLIHT